MISGGQSSQNVFNLNLGQFELDKDIKKLSEQIKKLVEQLDSKKLATKEKLSSEQKMLRDVNKCELEVENFKSLKIQI